jgi:3-phytase
MRRFLPIVATLSVLLAAPAAAAGTDRAGEKPLRVTAAVETPPLFDDEAGGDADADDPAIWVHPRDRVRSLVLVTAKNAGLFVYDLAGRQVQAIRPPASAGPDDAPGRFNNVDLLGGVDLGGGRRADLAVVTDRGHDTLRFYAIDPVAGRLVDVTAATVPFAFSASQAEVNEQATAYGLAVFRGLDGQPYAAVSRRHTTRIGLFRLVPTGGRVSYARVDTPDLPGSFRLPDGTAWRPCAEPGEDPQVEGMVVDPTTGVLYAAQEDVALWRIDLRGSRFAGRPRIVERVREYGVPAVFDPEQEECVIDFTRDPGFGGRIAADIEGLTIYPTGRRGGVVVVSSQGDSTFYTFDRRTNRPLGHFAVTDGPVDGAQHSDGAHVVGTPLPGFPHGLLVVHDGENTPDIVDDQGDVRPNTNVKYLDAGFLVRAGQPPAL